MWLEVYLPYHDRDQQEVQAIVRQVQQIAGLHVAVRMIGAEDLSGLFVGAVPIYLLNGQLLAAGHPPPEALLAVLRQRAQEPSQAEKLSVQQVQVAAVITPPNSVLGKSSLLRFDVFRDLSLEVLAALSSKIQLRKFAKGEAVFWQGDEARELFLLQKGRVELYHLTRHGKRLQLGVVQPGAFFGETCLLGESRYFTIAEVVQESEVAAISRSEVERLIREQPDFSLHLVRELCRRLQLDELRLVTLAYHDVSTRLAAELLYVSRQEHAVLLPITHQELGERSGLLRETVTKTLDAFQEEGLVELHRGRIYLRDMPGLEALLDPLDTAGIF